MKDYFWRPMKIIVSECTLHVVHCIRRNIEGSWGEKEKFYRKEEETVSFRWFQQNWQGFRNLHDVPTRSRQAFFWRQRKREREERKKGMRNDEKKIRSFSWNLCRHLRSEILIFKQVCFFGRNVKPFYNRT